MDEDNGRMLGELEHAEQLKRYEDELKRDPDYEQWLDRLNRGRISELERVYGTS